MVAGSAVPAQASPAAATGTPITYTERTIASGRLGSATFTNAQVTVNQAGSTLGVTDVPALAHYDLKTAFGPVTGPSYHRWGFSTTAGGLVLSSTGSVTFNATTP